MSLTLNNYVISCKRSDHDSARLQEAAARRETSEKQLNSTEKPRSWSERTDVEGTREKAHTLLKLQVHGNAERRRKHCENNGAKEESEFGGGQNISQSGMAI